MTLQQHRTAVFFKWSLAGGLLGPHGKFDEVCVLVEPLRNPFGVLRVTCTRVKGCTPGTNADPRGQYVPGFSVLAMQQSKNTCSQQKKDGCAA